MLQSPSSRFVHLEEGVSFPLGKGKVPGVVNEGQGQPAGLGEVTVHPVPLGRALEPQGQAVGFGVGLQFHGVLAHDLAEPQGLQHPAGVRGAAQVRGPVGVELVGDAGIEGIPQVAQPGQEAVPLGEGQCYLGAGVGGVHAVEGQVPPLGAEVVGGLPLGDGEGHRLFRQGVRQGAGGGGVPVDVLEQVYPLVHLFL